MLYRNRLQCIQNLIFQSLLLSNRLLYRYVEGNYIYLLLNCLDKFEMYLNSDF